jgi:hypothetical protein
MMLNDIRNHMRVAKSRGESRTKVDSARSMPRKPRKFKPGSELVQITFLVDATTAHEIDTYAARLAAEDPDATVSRTVALKKIVRAGLKALNESKP